MSTISLLGGGLDFVKLIGDKKEKKWAEKLYDEIFNGAFQVNIGSSVEAYYGGHYTHSFGSDSTLVFSSNILKTAGLFTNSYSSSAGGGGIFTGMNGLSFFNYGARTDLTYGGPASVIRRGITMSKLSNQVLPTLKGLWNTASDEQAAANPPQDAAGIEMAEDDAALVTVISVLSTLLYLVTAGAELAVRFAYPNYPTTSSTGSETLALLDKEIVPRIMGLIYSLDAAGGWSNLLSSYVAFLKRKLAWVGTPMGMLIFGVGVIVLIAVVELTAEIEAGSG